MGITNRMMGDDKTVYFEIAEGQILARVWDAGDDIWSDASLFTKSLDTGLTNSGLEWYSICRELQDGQSISWDNRILAESYKVQLIGSDAELVGANRGFDYYSRPQDSSPIWVGYENDNNNGNTAGHIEFNGIDTFAAATSPELWEQQMPVHLFTKWVDGKVPYSTTPEAVPDKEYKLRCKIKADSPIADAMDVRVEILGQDISDVIGTIKVLDKLDLTDSYQWYEGTFKIPNSTRAWIIKTIWQSLKQDAICYLDEWSITRADAAGESTENFAVKINGQNHSFAGTLLKGQHKDFQLEPTAIDNSVNIAAEIEGNRVGVARLIYERPILWSDDVSIGVNSVTCNSTGAVYNIDLAMVSRYTGQSISLSPLQYGVQVEGAIDVNIKKYYKAKTMNISQIPGTYKCFVPVSLKQ